jgi:hypothetical protein
LQNPLTIDCTETKKKKRESKDVAQPSAHTNADTLNAFCKTLHHATNKEDCVRVEEKRVRMFAKNFSTKCFYWLVAKRSRDTNPKTERAENKNIL